MSIKLVSSFITKTTYPLCINCANYITNDSTYPYDKMRYDKMKIGKCSLFGKQSLVTGQIEYENALHCRDNWAFCGERGAYYENRNKNDKKYN